MPLSSLLEYKVIPLSVFPRHIFFPNKGLSQNVHWIIISPAVRLHAQVYPREAISFEPILRWSWPPYPFSSFSVQTCCLGWLDSDDGDGTLPPPVYSVVLGRNVFADWTRRLRSWCQDFFLSEAPSIDRRIIEDRPWMNKERGTKERRKIYKRVGENEC